MNEVLHNASFMLGASLLILIWLYVAARLAVWGGLKSFEKWLRKQQNKEDRDEG